METEHSLLAFAFTGMPFLCVRTLVACQKTRGIAGHKECLLSLNSSLDIISCVGRLHQQIKVETIQGFDKNLHHISWLCDETIYPVIVLQIKSKLQQYRKINPLERRAGRNENDRRFSLFSERKAESPRM
jgi:IS30 family transposase